MSLSIAGVQDAADTWTFTVSGIEGDTASINYGDGTATTALTATGGVATIQHQFAQAGHHTYTVRAWAPQAPLTATLTDLSNLASTLTALVPFSATLLGFSTDTATASMQATVDVGEATIEAVVVAGSPPFVQLNLWFDTPETITLYEVIRSATGYPDLMIWMGITTAGAEVVLDREAPLNVSLTYTLRVYRGSITPTTFPSNTVTLSATGCWVSDPYALGALKVTLVAWPEREYAARRSIMSVLGRSDPVVISDAHLYATGTWRFATTSDAETANLLTILTGSGTCLLRTQPGSSIATVYASVGDVSVIRQTGQGGDQRRWVDVPIQEINPIPAAARLLDTSLYDLSLLADTLLELSELRPTLEQLAQIRGTS